MLAITIRNLKLFFRDKGAVFFSILSVLIVIGLYVLFLGDNMGKSFTTLKDSKLLVTTWIVSGIIAVTSISTTLGAFSIIVNDRQLKIFKDFSSSPLKRYQLVSGYILSSFIVGVLMTLIALILSLGYITFNGGELPSPHNIIKILGIILLSVLSNSAIMLFIVSFFKSHSGYSAASAVVGTLIGFLTGTYIPIGGLPESVQLIIKLFPPSHSAALLRQTLMENTLTTSFSGIPSKYLEEFNLNMGITYKIGDALITPSTSILILIGTAVIFFILGILNISKKLK
ncbi:MAG: ABC transporter permease [Clostridium sp.]